MTIYDRRNWRFTLIENRVGGENWITYLVYRIRRPDREITETFGIRQEDEHASSNIMVYKNNSSSQIFWYEWWESMFITGYDSKLYELLSSILKILNICLVNNKKYSNYNWDKWLLYLLAPEKEFDTDTFLDQNLSSNLYFFKKT